MCPNLGLNLSDRLGKVCKVMFGRTTHFHRALCFYFFISCESRQCLSHDASASWWHSNTRATTPISWSQQQWVRFIGVKQTQIWKLDIIKIRNLRVKVLNKLVGKGTERLWTLLTNTTNVVHLQMNNVKVFPKPDSDFMWFEWLFCWSRVWSLA